MPTPAYEAMQPTRNATNEALKSPINSIKNVLEIIRKELEAIGSKNVGAWFSEEMNARRIFLLETQKNLAEIQEALRGLVDKAITFDESMTNTRTEEEAQPF